MRCAAASTRLREFRHVLKGTAAGGGTELGPLTGAMLDKEGAFIISLSLFKKLNGEQLEWRREREKRTVLLLRLLKLRMKRGLSRSNAPCFRKIWPDGGRLDD